MFESWVAVQINFLINFQHMVFLVQGKKSITTWVMCARAMLPSKNHVLSWNYPKALSRYLITNVTLRAIISVKSHIFLYSFYFLRVLNNNRLEWDYDTFLIIQEKPLSLQIRASIKLDFYWRSEFFPYVYALIKSDGAQ